MSLTDSFAEYREIRMMTEELCQEMYNDLNEGKPSMALRYLFFQELKTLIEDEPYEDTLVQSLMNSYVAFEMLMARVNVTVQTIQIPKED